MTDLQTWLVLRYVVEGIVLAGFVCGFYDAAHDWWYGKT